VIKRPQEFYKIYSSDFGNFLDDVYEKNNLFDIDVFKLIELGTLSIKNRNYREAAFYFEAALQIEKKPEIRYRVLSQLPACYFKTGNAREAGIILEKIHDYEKGNFFNVIPDKGF